MIFPYHRHRNRIALCRGTADRYNIHIEQCWLTVMVIRGSHLGFGFHGADHSIGGGPPSWEVGLPRRWDYMKTLDAMLPGKRCLVSAGIHGNATLHRNAPLSLRRQDIRFLRSLIESTDGRSFGGLCHIVMSPTE